MAKSFTHKQSIEAVMAAIQAQTNPELSEGRKAQVAKAAVEVVKDSNSMVVAEVLDEAIAQGLIGTLDNAQEQLEGNPRRRVEAQEVKPQALPEPKVEEGVEIDDIPF